MDKADIIAIMEILDLKENMLREKDGMGKDIMIKVNQNMN